VPPHFGGLNGSRLGICLSLSAAYDGVAEDVMQCDLTLAKMRLAPRRHRFSYGWKSVIIFGWTAFPHSEVTEWLEPRD